ncbi:MAG TPA: HEPN domain-containing protein [Lamprocystis sp. (in: g-proteobacteria)]|nr:HEPN domain-containing protein [Lamprocystis sp. (in: g-proteobacteria)]
MKPEIRAVLDKAVDKLRVAQLLLGEGAGSDAVSRAYYAAFHAVSALHLSQGRSFSSHAQVIGQFNKDFVRTARFPQEFTRILARLFEDRQSGDYDVASAITADEARQDVADAEKIVDAVTIFLTSV